MSSPQRLCSYQLTIVTVYPSFTTNMFYPAHHFHGMHTADRKTHHFHGLDTADRKTHHFHGMHTADRKTHNFYGTDTANRNTHHFHGMDTADRKTHHFHGTDTVDRKTHHFYGMDTADRKTHHFHGVSIKFPGDQGVRVSLLVLYQLLALQLNCGLKQRKTCWPVLLTNYNHLRSLGLRMKDMLTHVADKL